MKVGDKVKITDSPYFHTPNGREGIITDQFPEETHGLGINALFQVKFEYYAATFHTHEMEVIE